MKDFSCDYNCGAADEIITAMTKMSKEQNMTYGNDKYTASAIKKIKKELNNDDSEVWFLIGGTQTNMTVLDYLVNTYDGIVCASNGHIAVHESGAVEYTGHSVIKVGADEQGKIDKDALKAYLKSFYADATNEHMSHPGAVYISQPTEYGGLYCKKDLTELRKICNKYGMKLYVDGARLAYALASPINDVTLADLAKYTDAFYIGGTKCGAFLGEAVVFSKPAQHFFIHRKQHGALLAKGFVLGIQFDTLFTDGLYYELGKNAIDRAMELKTALAKKNVEFAVDSYTNQQFILIDNSMLAKLKGKIGYDLWGKKEDKTIIRLCTSWKTTKEDVDYLVSQF